MVPAILNVTIERKGGILSSSHPFFLTKQSKKKQKPSHHKATHMIHKILNKMTESGDKGKRKTQGQWNQVAADLGQLPAPFKNTKYFL